MNKALRYALRSLVACFGLGAIPAVIELIFSGMTAGAFFRSALIGTLFALSIAVPCWFILPRIFCRLEDRSLRVQIAAAIPVVFALAAAGCLATDLLLTAAGVFPASEFASNYWYTLRVCVLITLAASVVSIGYFILEGRLNAARAALHERQMAGEREGKMVAEARFASLESRVRPHFLFNTLNTISALVREDPVQAERTIERLSALLRYSLDSEVEGLVTLRDELAIVRDYLEIERVRFGERLRYRIDADEAAQSMQVPALSLQTLAENSVKYAVGPRREGAEILISAHLVNGALRMEVSDDGPGFEPASSVRPGHGLDLLQRRLAALFGAAASLEMSARDGRMHIAISVAA
jgi:two-component sensor histidine kinase